MTGKTYNYPANTDIICDSCGHNEETVTISDVAVSTASGYYYGDSTISSSPPPPSSISIDIDIDALHSDTKLTIKTTDKKTYITSPSELSEAIELYEKYMKYKDLKG